MTIKTSLKRTIAVVTGSRAEYGVMKNIIKGIDDDPELNLILFVTGSHLLPEFGNTYKEIENDGFTINEKIQIIPKSNDNAAICESMGETMIGFSKKLSNYDIDILLLLGDRYEIFAVASTAYMLKIPIAHISGGDSTEGALDEALRHSITKMSHIHFVTNEVARKRVMQLGENPDNIYLVGNPSLDGIHNYDFFNRDKLSNLIGITLQEKIIMVTYHPETLNTESEYSEIEPLLSALGDLNDDFSIVFTGTNSDSGGSEISKKISEFVSLKENAAMIESLGHLGYMSAIKIASAVVGNSSSGLVEAPSFQTPTVNIGNRQKGRVCADSVISVANKYEDIIKAINQAVSMDCSKVKNPYEFYNSSISVVKILKNIKSPKNLIFKKFYDLI